jgi:hypothetical protein
MKMILGLGLIVGGIVLGLWLGVWVMFIGGISGLISEIANIASGNVNGVAVGVNVVKIIFASFVGCVSFYVCFVPGLMLLNK